MEAGNGCKLVVGVDYGTTFTVGISFVLIRAGDHMGNGNIHFVNQWPPGIRNKTSGPSIISYRQDGGPHLWGFEVKPEMRSYAWTKLLLDRNPQREEFDDDLLEGVTCSEILKLPGQKETGEAVADYLSRIYHHIQQHIPREVGQLRNYEGDLSEDIATYYVTDVDPTASLEQITTVMGAKCGGTTIDSGFYQLLSHRLEGAFDRVMSQIRPGSLVMTKFETIKTEFTGEGENGWHFNFDLSAPEADRTFSNQRRRHFVF
ncbi:unnamed protein product [Penicillium egyptiacum]|uniref:Uncharacterized protein n=1 Tax=Penicillium egyptiacum TaxID=1303716 RepID=A0A9W4KET8_9EURO|nr:unnamed protein product [Penicillium egyptiacum]